MRILQNIFRIFRFTKLKKIIVICLLSLFFILFLHILWIQKSFDYPDLLKKSKTEDSNIIDLYKVNSVSNIVVAKRTKTIITSIPPVSKASKTKFNESNYTSYNRSNQVIQAMKHSWKAYKSFAWGLDEVYPLTNGSSVWMGTALTMIDSLDLLLLMNLTAEFEECIDWITKNLHFDLDKNHVSVFETTIRVLGGLLSAFNLSNKTILLEKAIDLGERLAIAYDTKTGIPHSDINLKKRIAANPDWTAYASTSEAYTVILELHELSRLSKNKSSSDAAKRIVEFFLTLPKKNGLVPIYIDPSTGKFESEVITLGARADSYYEYLLKYWIQTGKADRRLFAEYVNAIDGIKSLLIKKSQPNHLVYIAELVPQVNHKMDHLACFVPAMLALGVMHGVDSSHLGLAEQLAYTCYQMYARMPTGLSPEIVYFNQNPNEKEDIIVKPLDRFNLQRPEAIESFFYLYRITKNKKYQDWGWEIFKSFEKYSKVPWSGYVGIGNVFQPKDVQQRAKCESFWFSETLKYLYLLLNDDQNILPLNKYVFNTEGHPFPIIKTPKQH